MSDNGNGYCESCGVYKEVFGPRYCDDCYQRKENHIEPKKNSLALAKAKAEAFDRLVHNYIRRGRVSTQEWRPVFEINDDIVHSLINQEIKSTLIKCVQEAMKATSIEGE